MLATHPCNLNLWQQPRRNVVVEGAQRSAKRRGIRIVDLVQIKVHLESRARMLLSASVASQSEDFFLSFQGAFEIARGDTDEVGWLSGARSAPGKFFGRVTAT